MSESLHPGGLQYTRLPCPSLTHGVCSNSCPLSLWCYPFLSSSVTHFYCPWYFPASGSFPVSWLFKSGGQGIAVSASASVLSMTSQGQFPLGLTGLISLQFKGLSRVFSSTTIQNPSIIWHSAFFMIRLSHPYMTTGKPKLWRILTNTHPHHSPFGKRAHKVIMVLPKKKKNLCFYKKERQLQIKIAQFQTCILSLYP